ncbi:MAG: hypothetical protein ACJ790_18590 [Myxococcaceae bacterium]
MRTLVPALLIAVVLTACGPQQPPPPPPPPDPPQVFVTVPESNVVGSEMEVRVSVTGCDSVTALALFTNVPGGSEHQLKSITWSGNPTIVKLQSKEIPYQEVGIAAHLALKAKAACDDGRTNTSTAVAATFFPVAQKISQGGAQVLPDVFVADGFGTNVLFTGCAGGNVPGTTVLAQVNATGEVTQIKQNIPYPCAINSVITERNNASGRRWLWTDDVGGFAFDANLNIGGASPSKTNALGVMPNGDAIVWNKSALNNPMSWIGGGNGAIKWSGAPQGQLAGPPTLRNTFGVYVPEVLYDFGSNSATFQIENFDDTNGVSKGLYALTTWQYGLGDTPYIPQAAFNNDVTIVYLPIPLAGGISSQVWACSTTTPCNPSNARWAASLDGQVQVVVPFHGGSKLVAAALDRVWFLDANTGAVLNKGGQAIFPSQGLVTLSIEVDKNGQDVYLFNTPIPREGQTSSPFAVEVVGIDSPAQGEVFRFQLDNSSLIGALDDGSPAQLWMRIGPDMVKPLPLAEYRAVHPTN